MAKGIEQQFADWVATRDPGEAYPYGDSCGCAFWQFLNETGYPVLFVGGVYWIDTNDQEQPLSGRIRAALVGFPWTFGALAERLAS